MINTAVVTNNIKEQFKASSDLVGFTITRGDYLNQDPSMCPWIGIYCSALEVAPKTLGRGALNWRSVMVIRIFVEAYSALSSEESEDLLGAAVEKVVNVVIADPTFGGSLEMVNGYNIEYSYKETDSSTLEFRWAIISFTAEARSTS